MKRVILAPNPYRDRNFQTVRKAAEVLRSSGIEVHICLPFELDRTYDLPRDLRFSRLDREIQNTDAIICFGGDGTILHMAKAATRDMEFFCDMQVIKNADENTRKNYSLAILKSMKKE